MTVAFVTSYVVEVWPIGFFSDDALKGEALRRF